MQIGAFCLNLNIYFFQLNFFALNLALINLGFWNFSFVLGIHFDCFVVKISFRSCIKYVSFDLGC